MPGTTTTPDSLADYRRMRDFAHTPEPSGATAQVSTEAGSFVIQKHAARSLHYDFRLELDGTLKSWAVPKGPSLDPSVRRMAVQVEDHPMSYAEFEGTIPPGHYGAGTVIVWDRGRWAPVGDARAGLRDGHLKFDLDGEKLLGRWALVRMKPRGKERQPAWLLIKDRDAQARVIDEYDVLAAEPDSVIAAKTKSKTPPRRTGAEAPRTDTATAPVETAKNAERSDSVKNADARAVKRAPQTALPEALSPQLATLVATVPSGADWLYEVKFDGYRLLTRVDGESVRCFTRNGNDWSDKMPALVAAIARMDLPPCWLDGEIVVLDERGIPSFQRLQNAFDTHSTDALTYFVFDLPFVDGHDLRGQPLVRRRERLQAMLPTPGDGAVRFSEAFPGDAAAMLASATALGLEGLIGKRGGSIYRSSRSLDWVKLKTQRRQEFVVGGYTCPQGSRTGIGSLLLGIHEDTGKLRYAGNVGSGFDEATLTSLKARLDELDSDESPFADPPKTGSARGGSKPHWVEPVLVVEVSFAQWTDSGRIRHAVFHGLRDDKPARRITREKPHDEPLKTSPASAQSRKTAPAAPVPGQAAVATRRSKAPSGGAMQVTHAERVIDAESGVTKGELVEYYRAAAALMLPHLRSRPVALVRAPGGVGGAQFFQKHAEAKTLPGVTLLDPSLDPGHEALIVVGSQRGLLSAAQMNVIELHTWNMTERTIPAPDRMIFDLDPGEGVAWPAMREATRLVRSLLDELGLESVAKTSGGKGMHLVVPLAPRHDWEMVREFSEAVVVHLAKVIPQRFVAKSGPKNRVGKIFVDYLRNGWGSTTAAAWSARSRPGLGVSVPIDWSELDGIDGAARWTVRNAAERFTAGNSPWGDALGSSRQTLAKAKKALGFSASKTK